MIILVHLEWQMSPSRQRIKETIKGEMVAKVKQVSVIEADMVEMRGSGQRRVDGREAKTGVGIGSSDEGLAQRRIR